MVWPILTHFYKSGKPNPQKYKTITHKHSHVSLSGISPLLLLLFWLVFITPGFSIAPDSLQPPLIFWQYKLVKKNYVQPQISLKDDPGSPHSHNHSDTQCLPSNSMKLTAWKSSSPRTNKKRQKAMSMGQADPKSLSSLGAKTDTSLGLVHIILWDANKKVLFSFLYSVLKLGLKDVKHEMTRRRIYAITLKFLLWEITSRRNIRLLVSKGKWAIVINGKR